MLAIATVPTSFRLNPSTYTTLKARADARNISFSMLCREILDNACVSDSPSPSTSTAKAKRPRKSKAGK